MLTTAPETEPTDVRPDVRLDMTGLWEECEDLERCGELLKEQLWSGVPMFTPPQVDRIDLRLGLRRDDELHDLRRDRSSRKDVFRRPALTGIELADGTFDRGSQRRLFGFVEIVALIVDDKIEHGSFRQLGRHVHDEATVLDTGSDGLHDPSLCRVAPVANRAIGVP